MMQDVPSFLQLTWAFYVVLGVPLLGILAFQWWALKRQYIEPIEFQAYLIGVTIGLVLCTLILVMNYWVWFV